ncbi:hypothetical protein FXO38_23952 [Capsicum annuum]|nr:hypothetical protein FXO37_34479 [Capsicum annuum]KAF3636912.1 hypothetical protein FXO38_23952 [Capsicum annuum]
MNQLLEEIKISPPIDGPSVVVDNPYVSTDDMVDTNWDVAILQDTVQELELQVGWFLSSYYPSVGRKYSNFMEQCCVLPANDHLLPQMVLLLAYKYEEVSVPVVEGLILISEKAYARKEVLEMVELVSFFLIDLCLVEYEMLRFPPSMLAAAAIFTAQCTLGVSREWNATCGKHSSYGKNQIL